jgi:signal transduction histidine kinase
MVTVPGRKRDYQIKPVQVRVTPSDTHAMTPLLDVECAAPTRLLVIEDSPSDAMLLEAALLDSVLESATIVCESCLGAGLKRLAEGTFDGVLIDLGLPDSEGLETFSRIREAAGEAAVVVITGRDDSRLAEEAVRLGAQDYLRKSESRPGELGRAVDFAIRRQSVLRDLERARDEQLEARDRFLSHVSHELRSPLSVVYQFGSLLQDGIGGPLSAEQREFLEVLMRNVGQLKLMIDDLLSVSRVQGGRLLVESKPVAIRDLLAETVAAYRPAADQRGVVIAADAGDLPKVMGDQCRLREVLTNLVDNALKFTPKGGWITVEGVLAGDCVRVTVRDTGRGIPKDDLGRVFEQFFQVEQGDDVSRNGLGLGLFVCRDLIQRQGGVMWAESVPDHGTAVCFTVPIMATSTCPEAAA